MSVREDKSIYREISQYHNLDNEKNKLEGVHGKKSRRGT